MRIWDIYKKMSIPVKASIWFTICNFFQKGISFLTVPLFTRLMNTEQYGIYTIYMSWLQLFTILTSLYLFNGVYDNAMVKFEKSRNKYVSSMQGLTITITAVWWLIYKISTQKWEKLLGISQLLINLLFLESYLIASLSYWSGRQKFEYRYKILVCVTLLQALLTPIIGLFMMTRLGNVAKVRIGVGIGVQLFICLPIVINQFIKGKKFYDKRYWSYALKMGIPILPHYLSSMILNQGDRIMIDKMIGKTEVALYGVAYNIAMLAQLFITGINSAITPWIYEKIRTHQINCIKNVVTPLLIFIAMISMIIMLISPELVLFFGSNQYYSSAYVIPPVSASVVFIFLYGILSFPQFYYEKTYFLMIASMVAVVINIILNYIFISLFGFIAAGYTTLVCYMIYAIGHYYISKKILKLMGEKENILDIKSTGITIGAVIAMCIVSNFMFKYAYIRYCLLALVFFLVIVKHKKLIKYVKSLTDLERMS